MGTGVNEGNYISLHIKTTESGHKEENSDVRVNAKQNVLLAAKTITGKSFIVKSMVDAGQVVIAGCMYDLQSGVVTFYSN